jgi:hypothetical protein
MRLTNRQWTLTGWWLFVVSAASFIVASIRAGDMIGLLGACAFMAANIAFLIPFYRRSSRDDEHED